MANPLSLNQDWPGGSGNQELPLSRMIDEYQKTTPPIYSGEVLREEFLKPMQLTPYDAVARVCGIPRTRIKRLAREETSVTADTALRLARYFGATPVFCMGMQAQYDLERAQDQLAVELKRIEPIKQAAV